MFSIRGRSWLLLLPVICWLCIKSGVELAAFNLGVLKFMPTFWLFARICVPCFQWVWNQACGVSYTSGRGRVASSLYWSWNPAQIFQQWLFLKINIFRFLSVSLFLFFPDVKFSKCRRNIATCEEKLFLSQIVPQYLLIINRLPALWGSYFFQVLDASVSFQK